MTRSKWHPPEISADFKVLIIEVIKLREYKFQTCFEQIPNFKNTDKTDKFENGILKVADVHFQMTAMSSWDQVKRAGV